MLQVIAGLDANQTRIAIRAFSVLLDLMNVVEDRRRVRVLAERARATLDRVSIERLDLPHTPDMLLNTVLLIETGTEDALDAALDVCHTLDNAHRLDPA